MSYLVHSLSKNIQYLNFNCLHETLTFSKFLWRKETTCASSIPHLHSTEFRKRRQRSFGIAACIRPSLSQAWELARSIFRIYRLGREYIWRARHLPRYLRNFPLKISREVNAVNVLVFLGDFSMCSVCWFLEFKWFVETKTFHSYACWFVREYFEQTKIISVLI